MTRWAEVAWRQRAACKDEPTRLFFPDEGEPASPAAKAICGACPVRVECLEFAMATGQRAGVWGGLGSKQRERLRRRRRDEQRQSA